MQALAAELPGASYVRADIADETEAAALVASTVDRHGGLDILVNNAGTTAVIPHSDLDGRHPRRLPPDLRGQRHRDLAGDGGRRPPSEGLGRRGRW